MTYFFQSNACLCVRVYVCVCARVCVCSSKQRPNWNRRRARTVKVSSSRSNFVQRTLGYPSPLRTFAPSSPASPSAQAHTHPQQSDKTTSSNMEIWRRSQLSITTSGCNPTASILPRNNRETQQPRCRPLLGIRSLGIFRLLKSLQTGPC